MKAVKYGFAQFVIISMPSDQLQMINKQKRVEEPEK